MEKYKITLGQLTEWNTVLGYPDGKYCSTKFWAGYDYCVGVNGNVPTNPAINGSLVASANTVVPGKDYTVLPGDMPPSAYVVRGIDCVEPGLEFYQDCWKELKINRWLRKWYAEEPRCESRASERGCNIDFPDEVEAWTTTFIREYVGAGGSDCTTLPGACFFNPDPDRGAEIPALARARYRYVHHSILGTFLSCLFQNLDG